ncbi:MAG: hypothetical protein N3A66_04975, partial [Planctomycetota bacterium]|nr:hypothetical protein [Planctomycetota bacterium]
YDWEGASFDITDFIREVNALKRQHRVLAEDNRLERVESGNGDILALRKTTLDSAEAVLLLFNLSDREQEVALTALFSRLQVKPLRPEAGGTIARLRPWGAAVISLTK